MKRSLIAGVLGLLTALVAAPASAKLTWVPQSPAAPGFVSSVAVASNDVPFVSTNDGKVWYLGRGKACGGTPKVCLDKWIEIPGINTGPHGQLSMPPDGGVDAIEATSGKVMSTIGPYAPNIWIPQQWGLAQGWQPGCVSSVATTVPFWGGVLAFVTPDVTSANWHSDLYAVGCGGGYDNSLWILKRWNDGGIKSSPWRQIAVKQGGTSSKVAIFVTFQPAGPNEEVWFMDSFMSGGATFIYDKAKDLLVKQKNPPGPSTNPNNNPPMRGTAITDHYARFAYPTDITRGKIYRWDEDTQKWVFVIKDPPEGSIISIAYASPYESSAGTYGPSSLWASDTNGTLYVMRDLGVVQ